MEQNCTLIKPLFWERMATIAWLSFTPKMNCMQWHPVLCPRIRRHFFFLNRWKTWLLWIYRYFLIHNHDHIHSHSLSTRLPRLTYRPVRCSSGPPCPSCSSSSPRSMPVCAAIFLFSCYSKNTYLLFLSFFFEWKTMLWFVCLLMTDLLKKRLQLTWDGTFFGGSIRIEGSHSPGGRTVTWSRNSSIPAIRSLRSFAL